MNKLQELREAQATINRLTPIIHKEAHEELDRFLVERKEILEFTYQASGKYLTVGKAQAEVKTKFDLMNHYTCVVEMTIKVEEESHFDWIACYETAGWKTMTHLLVFSYSGNPTKTYRAIRHKEPSGEYRYSWRSIETNEPEVVGWMQIDQGVLDIFKKYGIPFDHVMVSCGFEEDGYRNGYFLPYKDLPGKEQFEENDYKQVLLKEGEWVYLAENQLKK